MTLQTQLLAAILCVVFGFGTGWTVKGWQYGAAETKAIKTNVKAVTKLNEESAPIITKRDADVGKTVYVYRTIKEKINAKPDNSVCFTADSVRLWNEAVTGSDSLRPELIEPAAEVDTAEASVREVLVNATDNYETCNTNSIKHNALIDKVESLKGKMCACPE